MKIEILGGGCPRCQATEKNVKQALNELEMQADIEHITDPKEYPKRGVVFTPAVTINDKLKVSGKIPTVEESKKWLLEEKEG